MNESGGAEEKETGWRNGGEERARMRGESKGRRHGEVGREREIYNKCEGVGLETG